MIVRISRAKSSSHSTTKPLSSTVRLSCCLGTKSNLTFDLFLVWFGLLLFFFWLVGWLVGWGSFAFDLK